MKYLPLLAVLFLIACTQEEQIRPTTANAIKPVIVIHGGAGLINPNIVNEELEFYYRKSLETILDSGYTLLEEGMSAEKVVERVLKMMEDDSLYNAGRGSVLNSKGRVEMDASIMSGNIRKAGAVTGIVNTKNPISLARLVKDSTQHVLLCGDGANSFARTMQVDTMPIDYFITGRRHRQWMKLRQKKYGTGGCVALDIHGNLAAGTSTGGMSDKLKGRVSDAAIIGAGTYADNRQCAVSATGWGEHFIRNVAAYQVFARMEYGGQGLSESVANTLLEVQETGGDGGLIAVDRQGNWVAKFNTDGMFRAARTPDTLYLGIFAE